MTVSATVLPRCNDTACLTVPRVVSYGPGLGHWSDPAFILSGAGDRPVMTITY